MVSRCYWKKTGQATSIAQRLKPKLPALVPHCSSAMARKAHHNAEWRWVCSAPPLAYDRLTAALSPWPRTRRETGPRQHSPGGILTPWQGSREYLWPSGGNIFYRGNRSATRAECAAEGSNLQGLLRSAFLLELKCRHFSCSFLMATQCLTTAVPALFNFPFPSEILECLSLY